MGWETLYPARLKNRTENYKLTLNSTEGSDIEAKDHTRYLVCMMALAALASVVYTFKFKVR